MWEGAVNSPDFFLKIDEKLWLRTGSTHVQHEADLSCSIRNFLFLWTYSGTCSNKPELNSVPKFMNYLSQWLQPARAASSSRGSLGMLSNNKSRDKRTFHHRGT